MAWLTLEKLNENLFELHWQENQQKVEQRVSPQFINVASAALPVSFTILTTRCQCCSIMCQFTFFDLNISTSSSFYRQKLFFPSGWTKIGIKKKIRYLKVFGNNPPTTRTHTHTHAHTFHKLLHTAVIFLTGRWRCQALSDRTSRFILTNGKTS